jgi:lysophospholipase L1-like esterase
MRVLLAVVALLISTASACADGPFHLKDGQKVVFLGDSNTFAGQFIAYLDAYLCTRFPAQRFELINLGLPSETVSGLSEPDHPYPRPNVHDRVDRALELTRPDVVVIGYGMNDGIYYPFSQERFEKYQQGIAKLVDKVEKAGAKAMLMSPAPFDPQPLKSKVLPKDAEKFSWLHPYERYDEEVLTRYSDWLLTWRQKKYTVIDAHAVLLKHIAAMRKDAPAYRISGDGVHPSADGHLVIALEILKNWNAPTAVMDIAIDVTATPPTQSAVKILSIEDNALLFSCRLPQPMPADLTWTPRARAVAKFDDMNRYALKIAGMKGSMTLAMKPANGKEIRAAVDADKLAKGVDFAKALKIEPDGKSSDAWKLIAEKNRILGLAWLTHVGHKRPDTPKGMPLGEARKKTAVLDEEIRKLCAPTEVSIAVGPFTK